MARTSKHRPAPPKPRPAPDNRAQSDRFIDAAQNADVKVTLEMFEEVFRKVTLGHLSEVTRETNHRAHPLPKESRRRKI